MLTQETKRKIDATRQILVGKVPDPKAQVDQITTALIYKFMDDMDKEAIELGGKARFFTNGFQKYSWTKVLDQKLSGHERLELYGEAVSKMSQNPHIPQLFRDIFKDAFLPYRSPETLTLFLKEINDFTYSHSEDLGDAFEYLLSILGSQGDAGQFRTPRHIIDFIVEVVDPKKGDTILDPACGTAGFLISAYKHIIKEQKSKPLTPDEKKKLMGSLVGYDISPDMVKLSKVNMYLHGFAEPKIFEYDTLSSEEKWDEMYDVMMANPPFMTPTGGIRPHKRFSIQANRSEVLFVDYIKEHLRPNGRAGIIVPEGVVFQSGLAYKQLRKMLIEDGLFAVASLPSGVFNPYAGVKTSILFFDNSVSKQTKEILFVKINNDGFDLGAQRREIDKNDIPEVIKILNKWKKGEKVVNKLALYVKKTKIAESGDFNLSGDRYRTTIDYSNVKWPLVKLEEICDLQNGYAFKSNDYIKASNTLNFRMSNIRPDGQLDIDYNPKYLPDEYTIKYKDYILNNGDVVIAMTDMASDPKILGVPTIIKKDNRNLLLNQRVGKFIKIDENKVFVPFLKYILNAQNIKDYLKNFGGGGLQINISKKDILKIGIPLPPLEVQKQVVFELNGYQNIINGSKQISENWKPVVEIDSKYEKVRLGEKSEMFSGLAHENVIKDNGKYILINSKFISSEGSEYKRSDSNLFPLHVGDVVMCMSDVPNGKTLGKCFYVDVDNKYTLNQRICVFRTKDYDKKFLYYFLNRNRYFLNFDNHQSQTNLRKEQVLGCPMPLIPINIQKEIVEKIEKEKKLIESSKELIEVYEQKAKETIAKLWE